MLSLPRYTRHRGPSRNILYQVIQSSAIPPSIFPTQKQHSIIYVLTWSKQDVTVNYTYPVYRLIYLRYYTESYILIGWMTRLHYFSAHLAFSSPDNTFGPPDILLIYNLSPRSFLTGILSNLSYDSPSATSILLSEGLSSWAWK